MKVLIFDTETTGLPVSRNYRNPLWYKKHPHIVQVSWILFDTVSMTIMNITDHIVKVPDHIGISESSIAVHGITKERSMNEGVDIKQIIFEFLVMLDRSDMIIGHNIDFDIRMIKAEYLRNGCIDPFVTKKYIPTYCTMEKGTRICKILATNHRTGNKYYKWPKLIQLHKKLFNTEPKNLHNSLTDIYVTLRCYYFIEKGIDLLSSSKNFANRTKHIFV